MDCLSLMTVGDDLGNVIDWVDLLISPKHNFWSGWSWNTYLSCNLSKATSNFFTRPIAFWARILVTSLRQLPEVNSLIVTRSLLYTFLGICISYSTQSITFPIPYGLQRAGCRSLWRVQIQEYLTASIQNMMILLRHIKEPTAALGKSRAKPTNNTKQLPLQHRLFC